MVGSLMYLTASRPDLVFAVCMYARYQALPTKKHLKALKRVFWYLRGTINWGLWYPKDTAMALTAYADADHTAVYLEKLDSGLTVLDSSLANILDSGLVRLPDSGLTCFCLIEVWSVLLDSDKMADKNVSAPTPTRSDDQILLFAAWVPIGKSNYEFTASALVPTICIQQFWNTLTYEAKTGAYSFELDETRFVLDANLLRGALEITPIDQAHQFVSPLSGDAIMDFVNELGYTEVIHFVSRMAVNNLYQPWRAILSMINQCLTGKTSRNDRPRYPVLQML
ncbi:hypothetical protein Tco_1287709 [Tanacetum coccineum]